MDHPIRNPEGTRPAAEKRRGEGRRRAAYIPLPFLVRQIFSSSALRLRSRPLHQHREEKEKGKEREEKGEELSRSCRSPRNFAERRP